MLSALQALLVTLALFQITASASGLQARVVDGHASHRGVRRQHERRALPDNLGLSENNLEKNGISFGFLPAYGESKSPNTATSLNALLPKPMAVVGAYAQINTKDLSFTQIDAFVDDILKQPGAKPVLALALMPNEGLDSVNMTVAFKIATKMLAINNKGITVWLRYAHEANGDWYAWGQKPEAFIASWKMVANAVHGKAPLTYMWWSPNSLFANDGSVDNPAGGYTPYWPGKSYVDLVGISFYHYGGFERQNILPTPDEASSKMTQFHEMYAAGQGLPMVLSETGGAYTKDLATGEPAPGGAEEYDIKMEWLHQITSPDIAAALPHYKAACHFEVIKDENASGDSIVKEEDFRILTGNDEVADAVIEYFST